MQVIGEVDAPAKATLPTVIKGRGPVRALTEAAR